MQKTELPVTIFVVGLLCGGLLVWAFATPITPNIEDKDSTTLQKQAFDACLTAGGIPILNSNQDVERCQQIVNRR